MTLLTIGTHAARILGRATRSCAIVTWDYANTTKCLTSRARPYRKKRHKMRHFARTLYARAT